MDADSLDIEFLLQNFHESPTRLVLALAGDAADAVLELLGSFSARPWVLSTAILPSRHALAEWMGGGVDEVCAESTARSLAMTAFLRANELAPENRGGYILAGIGLTVGSSNEPIHPTRHCVHVATQTVTHTHANSLELSKGTRVPAEELKVASRMVLNHVAIAFGLDRELDLGLIPGEQLTESLTEAPTSWRQLVCGETDAFRVNPSLHRQEPTRPSAVFSGAFNPVHSGHRRMIEIARQVLKTEVGWEISVVNVAKPAMDYTEIAKRLDQFALDETPLWLTRAATFVDKSLIFPGVTFVVGVDTVQRIAQPRYYADGLAGCHDAINRIAQRNCRFLVFGRTDAGRFQTLSDLDLPGALTAMCRQVDPEVFRDDISSTSLRQGTLRRP